jgi:hypothetical protein
LVGAFWVKYGNRLKYFIKAVTFFDNSVLRTIKRIIFAVSQEIRAIFKQPFYLTVKLKSDMSILKSKGFKYLKNLIIGVGAAVVLVGALFKIMSWPGANEMLTIGLLVEAGLFLMLGLLGPEKDYYWEKLYPGLDSYDSKVEPLERGLGAASSSINFNSEGMESKMDVMVGELQTMARSMSALKALQEVDFTSTGDQIKKMGQFYANLNEAMSNINDSIEDTRVYKEQLGALNKNLGSLNGVYGSILSAYSNLGK